MKTGKISIVFFFLCFSRLSGQVISSDSLALVSLYNATNGTNWVAKTNWLSSTVGQWQGVTIFGGRVTELNLTNNNLIGTLPNQFCDLTALKYLYLSTNTLTGTLPTGFGNMAALNTIDLANNQLSGAIPPTLVSFPQLADLYITNNDFDELPNMSGMPEIANVLIANNKFTFEDIIPNRTILNFQYSPQDSINIPLDTTADIKDTAVFNLYTSGSGHNYQWIRDGQNLTESTHLNGTNSGQLTINKLQLADSGMYTVSITNPLAPLLTLYRNRIRLSINDTRVQQLFYELSPSSYVCGDAPMILNDTLNSLLPVSYQLLSGNAVLLDDTIKPYNPGEITIRCFNDGDDTYKPITKDSIITVNTPLFSVPVIEKTIPTAEGEPLQLSVTNIGSGNYYWVSPAGDTTRNTNVDKATTTTADEGFYFLSLNNNECTYYLDSLEVRFNQRTYVVYELITPDGDAKNDFFFIDTKGDSTAVEVTILNTWGQQVYKNRDYQNDWSGDELPSGTYYYVVKVASSNKLVKGALYLKR